MVEGKKFIVGLAVVVLILVGGTYTVNILDDKIVVSLPSDYCPSATLRVTKDDFTLKCGRFIAFQADTITEYYKTYGTDEWVRNNRFVGLNKKHITLELNDYGNYFDIIRKTRYRKGRQNIDDGVMYETYTFTKDNVKITYNYEVNNKALHRVSMRIKKQVDSYLDAFDPNGHTGILTGNVLYYEGYGDLIIDPLVSLVSPVNTTTNFNESAVASFVCNASNMSHSTQRNISNITFHWNALNGSTHNLTENGSVTFSPRVVNGTATFSRIIPFQAQYPGSFKWACAACSVNQSGGDPQCNWTSTNRTVFAQYRPQVLNIDTDSSELNILNGTDWPLKTVYPTIMDEFSNTTIQVNWSYTGNPMISNGSGILINISYVGSINSSNRRFDNLVYSANNGTINATFNVTNLAADRYYLTVSACNTAVPNLCRNDTTTNAIEVLDYTINISTGASKIRFSTQPTLDKGAALGQTLSQGIIAIDWLGYSYPNGIINISVNLSAADKCMTMYGSENNSAGTALTLTNQSYILIINSSDSDPDYIWLWADKRACGTTTLGFSMDLDIFHGGT